MNKIENRDTFEIKTGYCLEILTSKTMALVYLEALKVR